MSTMKQFKYKHRHRLICTDRPLADLNEWKERELKYLLNSMKLNWSETARLPPGPGKVVHGRAPCFQSEEK